MIDKCVGTRNQKVHINDGCTTRRNEYSLNEAARRRNDITVCRERGRERAREGERGRERRASE